MTAPENSTLPRQVGSLGHVLLIGSHERAFVNFRQTVMSTLARRGYRVTAVVWADRDTQADYLADLMNQLGGRAIWLGAEGGELDAIA